MNVPDVEPSLELDLRSAIPPFEQTRARVTELVVMGELAPGTRLPSVRALAADPGVAPGTVARAYRELEAEGTVATVRGKGTAVAATPPRADPRALQDTLLQAVRAARAAGWDSDRINAAVRDALG